MEEKAVLLTQDAYDELKAELAKREGSLREEIAAKIAAARAEGDLSENGGYQAAREEQGKNEGRINELIVKLRIAQIVNPTAEGTVGVGSIVVIDRMGDEETYLFGSRENAADSGYDTLDPESPAGKAIDGAKVGDTVTYKAPNGRDIKVVVKSAKPVG